MFFSFEKLEDTAKNPVISINHYEEMREMINTQCRETGFLSLTLPACISTK